MAIIVTEPLLPFQLRPRSNKFVWSKSQVDDVMITNVHAEKPLTVVELSKVCRTVYEEVALTRLFYKVNRFRFASYSYRLGDPTPYLLAITTPRMKAIRSITCSWDFDSKLS